MVAAFTSSEPGLVAYYPFTEGQGQTLHDSSLDHFDATLGTGSGNLPTWQPLGGSAIDLAADGPTLNAATPRQGPNDLQNYPVLVTTADGHLRGRLAGSLPNVRYHLEFFASAGLAPDGSGEAQLYLGSLDVTTDPSGQAVFSVPYTPPADKPFISATATDPRGNTSELSGLRQATLVIPSRTAPPVYGAPLSLSTATGGAITLADPDAGPLGSVSVWDVSLTATAGTLSLAGTAGLTGTGDGTGSLHYSGTIPALNAALNGLRFMLPPGLQGLASLSLTASSPGAAPLSGRLSVGYVTSTADSGRGSLRQAILDADAAGGSAIIGFAIPGSGAHAITPAAALPAITAAVLLDGTTQPGYAGTPLIEIRGATTVTGDGLSITGSNTTVRGLAIDGFSGGSAIVISGPDATGDMIEANYLGIDPTGTHVRPNKVGVLIKSGAHDNTVGGSANSAGNLIEGNITGVLVTDSGSVGNSILGNRIFDDGRDTPTPSGKLAFYSTAGYVQLPSFPLGGAITLEAWVEADSPYVRVFDLANQYGSQEILLVAGYGGKMQWGMSDQNGSWHQIVTSADFPQGRWVYVAATVDEQGYGAIYWDGQQVASGFVGIAPVVSRTNQYVAYTDYYSDLRHSGALDEVRIWSAARTAEQIMSDSQGPLSGSEPRLEAYYRFDEGFGTIAHDSTANHRDATLATNGTSAAAWIGPGTGQAIDSGGDGVTPNTPGPRSQTSGLPNFPIIVTTTGGYLRGWLPGGLANMPYHLEFFASAAHAPDGGGEAEVYLGSLEVTTDGRGEAVFDVSFAVPGDKPIISATATDQGGNTSEISIARQATLTIPSHAVPSISGAALEFSSASGDAIALDDPMAGPLSSVSSWDLSLSVTAGALSLVSTAGLIGAGNATDKLHYAGTIPELNAALNGLRFTPPTGFQGLATLSLAASSPGAVPLWRELSISFLRVTSAADSGAGSLRRAVESANAAPGPAIVNFAIPGPGLHTIALATPLPPITGIVVLDGFSQPGYAGTPLLALSGHAAGISDALVLTGANVTARGLAIDGVAFDGLTSGVLTIQSGQILVPVLIGAGAAVDSYRIDVTADERLLAELHPDGLTARLSLLDCAGPSPGPERRHLAWQFRWPDRSAPCSRHVFPRGCCHRRHGRLCVEDHAHRGFPAVSIIEPGAPPPGNNEQELSFAVGDFNGDAITDIVGFDGVHLGVGDGTFRVPLAGLGTWFLPAYGPSGMITGDFNSDGKLDLAVTDFNLPYGYLGSNPLAILLGNGDGTFQTPKFFWGAVSPIALGAGDFDRDGKLDLAILDFSSSTLWIQFGNGDGTFQIRSPGGVAPEYVVGAGSFSNHPRSLVVGDFNGDGMLDLAVANDEVSGNSDVSILLGQGDGTFQEQRQFTVGGEPAALVAGDFNGDGKLDLATADGLFSTSPSHHDVSVLLGNGDGTFQPWRQFDTGAGTSPNSLVVGDFTGDGKLDLATADFGSNEVSVLLGNGNGTFQAARRFAAGSHPFYLAAADFNRDGRQDLAVDDGTSVIKVLLGNGDGNFQEQPGFATGSNPTSWVAGDFNRDGKLDLAVANAGSGDISVLLGNGDGTFDLAVEYAVGDQPYSVVAGDFNGDGSLDLAAANSDRTISILLGRGDGTFLFRVQYAVDDSLSGPLMAIDLTGNGRLDLVAGNQVLLGNGDGTFRALRIFPSAIDAIGLAAGDFSGDGWLNMTALAMAAPVSVDFNGDSRPDRVSLNSEANEVSVSLGQGDGTYVPAGSLATAVHATPVAADFNRDATLDVFELQFDRRDPLSPRAAQAGWYVRPAGHHQPRPPCPRYRCCPHRPVPDARRCRCRRRPGFPLRLHRRQLCPNPVASNRPASGSSRSRRPEWQRPGQPGRP